MTPGKRYIVRYKADNMRKPKEVVLDFMGETTSCGWQGGCYQFSARPIAGTQTLPRSWFISATEVGKDWHIKL